MMGGDSYLFELHSNIKGSVAINTLDFKTVG